MARSAWHRDNPGFATKGYTMPTDARFDDPGPDAQYKQALNAGRFRLQHCGDCAAVFFPPAMICRSCGSSKLTWKASPGVGIVYSTTTVRDRGGDYNVAIIELECGVRMMSRVDGVVPDQVRIGQNVIAQIVFGEEPFLVFAPAGGEKS
jgi:uncharacterized OB-fold protein